MGNRAQNGFEGTGHRLCLGMGCPVDEASFAEIEKFDKHCHDSFYAANIMLDSMKSQLREQLKSEEAYTIIELLKEDYDRRLRAERYGILEAFINCERAPETSYVEHVQKMERYVEKLQKLGHVFSRGMVVDIIGMSMSDPSSMNWTRQVRDACFHCGKVGHWKRNCDAYLDEKKRHVYVSTSGTKKE